MFREGERDGLPVSGRGGGGDLRRSEVWSGLRDGGGINELIEGGSADAVVVEDFACWID